MMEQMRSVDRMIKMFSENSELLDRLKTDPDPLPVLKETAEKSKEAAWVGDVLLFRIAVIVLGALALTAALGSIGLVVVGKTTPEVLVSLGSAAVGALVGLFAPTPARE